MDDTDQTNEKGNENFDSVVNERAFWLDQASLLYSASALLKSKDRFHLPIEEQRKILEEDRGKVDFFGVIQMLRGMYLECLLKAALVTSGIHLSKGGEMIRKYSHHKLKKLGGGIKDINFSDQENYLLERLTLWIEFGRYPSLKSAVKSKEIPLTWHSPADDETLKSIEDKLLNLFKTPTANEEL